MAAFSMSTKENPAGSTSKIIHINNNSVATVNVKTQKQSVNKGRVSLSLTY